MKCHSEMCLQLCIFPLGQTIGNYTSARPCRKEVGCQGDGERGEKKKGISIKQKSSKKPIQLCWELFPAHSTFLIVCRHTRAPTRGIFPSSNVNHQQIRPPPERETRQPSGSKEKGGLKHPTVGLTQEFLSRASQRGSLTHL